MTYTLDPDVPGLTVDSGMLSGAPTEKGVHEMTYTATDQDGDPASLMFTITVQEPGEEPEPPEPEPENMPPKADRRGGALLGHQGRTP